MDKIKCRKCRTETNRYDVHGKEKLYCSSACAVFMSGKKNKGRIMTDEHKRKTVQGHARKYGVSVCPFCSKEYTRYSIKQQKCTNSECVKKYQKQKYETQKVEDPIGAAARRKVGSIKLDNKYEIVKKMITDALGKPCVYCGSELTLENCNLDHKIPRKFSKVYNRKLKKRIYDVDVIRKLDQQHNLQIICYDCNQNKSDFSHDQFTRLLTILKGNEDIKEMIFKRFRYNRGFWGSKFSK